MDERYWFKQRRYGLGATPANWKGWAWSAAFVAAMAAASYFLSETRPLPFLAVASVLTAALQIVCWRKTEGGWRWRRGRD